MYVPSLEAYSINSAFTITVVPFANFEIIAESEQVVLNTLTPRNTPYASVISKSNE